MSTSRPAAIRGILFDFDGTLTRPGSIDFETIKSALGCPPDAPILEFIAALDRPAERREALRILDDHEMRAAAASGPNEGAEDVLRELRSRSITLGILSRNSRESILRALQNFTDVRPEMFATIVCRDAAPPKPDPGGILLAARRMKLAPEEVLTVGDYIFDVEAARRAGSPSVFLSNGRRGHSPPDTADHVITRLSELLEIVAVT